MINFKSKKYQKKSCYCSKSYKQKVIKESKKGIYLIPFGTNLGYGLSQRVSYEDWVQYWGNKLND